MARDGGMERKKRKIKTLKGPDDKSVTSGKRRNRGFKSLEQSSRKHRRAIRRLAEKCIFMGKQIKPGERTGPTLFPFQFKAGGTLNYH